MKGGEKADGLEKDPDCYSLLRKQPGVKIFIVNFFMN